MPLPPAADKFAWKALIMETLKAKHQGDRIALDAEPGEIVKAFQDMVALGRQFEQNFLGPILLNLVEKTVRRFVSRDYDDEGWEIVRDAYVKITDAIIDTASADYTALGNAFTTTIKNRSTDAVRRWAKRKNRLPETLYDEKITAASQRHITATEDAENSVLLKQILKTKMRPVARSELEAYIAGRKNEATQHLTRRSRDRILTEARRAVKGILDTEFMTSVNLHPTRQAASILARPRLDLILLAFMFDYRPDAEGEGDVERWTASFPEYAEDIALYAEALRRQPKCEEEEIEITPAQSAELEKIWRERLDAYNNR